MRLAPWFLGALILVGTACSRPAGEEDGVERPATDSTGFSLLVLDGRDGTPVAGARVTWFVRDPLYPRGWHDEVTGPSPAELEARCAASGKSGVTDAEGHVFVTCERFERVVVTASGGELWGQRDCWGTSWRVAEPKLKLYPDGDLAALVGESDGSPARDVSVSLRETHRWPRERDGTWGETVTALVSTRTGPDGVVTIRHARHEYARHIRTFPRHEGHEFRWSVDADLCTEDRIGADVELEPWPEDPLEITLPPMGEVEILVREIDGTLVATEGGIVLTTEHAALRGTDQPALFRFDPADAQWRRPAGGRVLFSRVGLGLDLVAFATRNEASTARTVRFTGPVRTADRVTAEIVFGRETATVRARAIRESGQPLARQRLFVEFHWDPGQHPDTWALSGGFVDTDAEGRFTVDFPVWRIEEGTARATVTHALGTPESLSACFELGDRRRPGVHDLGDLVLPLAPVLAGGTVVDPEGRPLDGATVIVTAYKGDPWSHRAVTDAEGRFTVRCATPYIDLDLDVMKPGFEREWLTFLDPGTEDLHVVLAPEEPDPPTADDPDPEPEDLDEIDEEQ